MALVTCPEKPNWYSPFDVTLPGKPQSVTVETVDIFTYQCTQCPRPPRPECPHEKAVREYVLAECDRHALSRLQCHK